VRIVLLLHILTDFNEANRVEGYKMLFISLSPSPFENGREAATRDTMDLIGGRIALTAFGGMSAR
jgi:hypothetical protein